MSRSLGVVLAVAALALGVVGCTDGPDAGPSEVGGGDPVPIEGSDGDGSGGDAPPDGKGSVGVDLVGAEVERLVAAGELCTGTATDADVVETVDVESGRVVLVACGDAGDDEVAGTELLLLGAASSLPLLAYGWDGEQPVLADAYAGDVAVAPDGTVTAVVTEGEGCGWRLRVVDLGEGQLRPAEVRAQPCPAPDGATADPATWPVAWTNPDR